VHVRDVVFHYRIRAGSASKNRVRQVTSSVRVRIDALSWFREQGVSVLEHESPAEILGVDLSSLYWTREWTAVDSLLALATDYALDSQTISRIRECRRYPEWLIRLKDRFVGMPRK
jgi:hypothetical protein